MNSSYEKGMRYELQKAVRQDGYVYPSTVDIERRMEEITQQAEEAETEMLKIALTTYKTTGSITVTQQVCLAYIERVRARLTNNPEYVTLYEQREQLIKEEKERAWKEHEARVAERKSVEVLAQLSNDECYNWDDVQLGRKPDGTLWYRAGSGCSCDSIDEYDWEPLRSYDDIKSYIDGNSGEPDDRAMFRREVHNALWIRSLPAEDAEVAAALFGLGETA